MGSYASPSISFHSYIVFIFSRDPACSREHFSLNFLKYLVNGDEFSLQSPEDDHSVLSLSNTADQTRLQSRDQKRRGTRYGVRSDDVLQDNQSYRSSS